MMTIFSVDGFVVNLIAKSSINVAYIDPSVTTYLIQAVAGVVIAVGAVMGIYWRKARKKVQDKLGIDENARKEVEDDIVEFTDDSKK